MKEKDNVKCKEWERRRREKLNDAFKFLAQLLPNYDPAKTLAKIDILERSTDFVKELRLSNSRLLSHQAETDEKCKLIKQLQDEVNKLILRVQQLTALLKQANILIPVGPSIKALGKKKLKWSDKLTPENLENDTKAQPISNSTNEPINPPELSEGSLIPQSTNTAPVPLKETNSSSATEPALLISNDTHAESVTIVLPNSSPNPVTSTSTTIPVSTFSGTETPKTTATLLPLQTIILTSCPMPQMNQSSTPIIARIALGPTRILPKHLELNGDSNALQKIPIFPIRKPLPPKEKKRRNRKKKNVESGKDAKMVALPPKKDTSSVSEISGVELVKEVTDVVTMNVDKDPSKTVADKDNAIEFTNSTDTQENLNGPDVPKPDSGEKVCRSNTNEVDSNLVEDKNKRILPQEVTQGKNDNTSQINTEGRAEGQIEIAMEVEISTEDTKSASKEEITKRSDLELGKEIRNNENTEEVMQIQLYAGEPEENEIVTLNSDITPNEEKGRSEIKTKLDTINDSDESQILETATKLEPLTKSDKELPELQSVVITPLSPIESTQDQPQSKIDTDASKTNSEISKSGTTKENISDTDTSTRPEFLDRRIIDISQSQPESHDADEEPGTPNFDLDSQIPTPNQETNSSTISDTVNGDKISECIARSIDLIDAPDGELIELGDNWGDSANSPKSPISPTQMFLSMFPLLPRESIVAVSEGNQLGSLTIPNPKSTSGFNYSSHRSFFIDSMLPEDHSETYSSSSKLTKTQVPTSNPSGLASSKLIEMHVPTSSSSVTKVFGSKPRVPESTATSTQNKSVYLSGSGSNFQQSFKDLHLYHESLDFNNFSSVQYPNPFSQSQYSEDIISRENSRGRGTYECQQSITGLSTIPTSHSHAPIPEQRQESRSQSHENFSRFDNFSVNNALGSQSKSHPTVRQDISKSQSTTSTIMKNPHSYPFQPSASPNTSGKQNHNIAFNVNTNLNMNQSQALPQLLHHRGESGEVCSNPLSQTESAIHTDKSYPGTKSTAQKRNAVPSHTTGSGSTATTPAKHQLFRPQVADFHPNQSQSKQQPVFHTLQLQQSSNSTPVTNQSKRCKTTQPNTQPPIQKVSYFSTGESPSISTKMDSVAHTQPQPRGNANYQRNSVEKRPMIQEKTKSSAKKSRPTDPESAPKSKSRAQSQKESPPNKKSNSGSQSQQPQPRQSSETNVNKNPEFPAIRQYQSHNQHRPSQAVDSFGSHFHHPHHQSFDHANIFSDFPTPVDFNPHYDHYNMDISFNPNISNPSTNAPQVPLHLQHQNQHPAQPPPTQSAQYPTKTSSKSTPFYLQDVQTHCEPFNFENQHQLHNSQQHVAHFASVYNLNPVAHSATPHQSSLALTPSSNLNPNPSLHVNHANPDQHQSSQYFQNPNPNTQNSQHQPTRDQNQSTLSTSSCHQGNYPHRPNQTPTASTATPSGNPNASSTSRNLHQTTNTNSNRNGPNLDVNVNPPEHPIYNTNTNQQPNQTKTKHSTPITQQSQSTYANQSQIGIGSGPTASVNSNVSTSSNSRPVNWMTDTTFRTSSNKSTSNTTSNPFSVSKLVGIGNNSGGNNANGIFNPDNRTNSTNTNTNTNTSYCAEALIRKNPSQNWSNLNLPIPNQHHFQPGPGQPSVSVPSSHQQQCDPYHHLNTNEDFNFTGYNAPNFHNTHNSQHYSQNFCPTFEPIQQPPTSIQIQHGHQHFHFPQSNNPNPTHHHHQNPNHHHQGSTSSVSNFNLSTIFPEINDKRHNANNANSGNNNIRNSSGNANSSGGNSGNNSGSNNNGYYNQTGRGNGNK